MCHRFRTGTRARLHSDARILRGPTIPDVSVEEHVDGGHSGYFYFPESHRSQTAHSELTDYGQFANVHGNRLFVAKLCPAWRGNYQEISRYPRTVSDTHGVQTKERGTQGKDAADKVGKGSQKGGSRSSADATSILAM